MSRTRVFRLLVPALVLGFLALEANAAQAQTGTITGRVTEQGTSRPLAGAQVFVAGTSAGTLTNSNGIYRLGDLEPGQRDVTALLIGYAPETETVTVRAGETVNLDFALSTTAISLDAIVATVTGQQRKRELANAASTIEAADLVRTRPVTSMADLLQARAPNVQVLQSSGTTGGGTRIRIRGSNSVSLSNEPLIYVDGVRFNNDPVSLSIGVGGQDPSALNDLNPEEIESIEIVKGPSAATLYGTDAANGVIRITTKRGRGGPPRWNFYVEGGLIANQQDYPLNFRGRSGDANCFAFQVGLGSCTQSALLSFQPLEDPELSPIGTGDRRQFGGSVSGGTDRINYFISGEYELENGYLKMPDFYRNEIREEGGTLHPWQETPNDLERINTRVNLGTEVAEGLRLDLSTGFTTADIHFPQNDNNSLGMIPSGVLGVFARELGNGGWGFRTPREVFAIETLQELDRFTGSLQANFQPTNLSWLTARAAVGLDVNNRHDSGFVPVGEVPASATLISGTRTSNRVNVRSETVDVGANATFDVTEEVRSRTSAGFQYFRDYFQRTETFGSQLSPGTKSVGAAALQTAGETTIETRTVGVFVEEQIAWRDRVFLTGAVRIDNNSAFGNDFELVTYPKAGLSVVLLEDDGDPVGGFLNSLRVRGAWGASGVAPGSTDALRFFDPVVATIADQSLPAVTFGEAGNVELKPERSSELEAGFDANLFDGRIGLEATFFHKTTDDALINRRVAPSLGLRRDETGTADRFENIGSVRNQGIELGINATILNLDNLQFDVNASGSWTDNELLELGEGVEPIIFGNQRHVEGFALGGYWDRPLEWSDADGNGIITPDEVSIDFSQDRVFLGNVFPAVEASINASLTLFDRIRASALFDHRGDFMNYNLGEEFRCFFAICEGINNPGASVFEQARAFGATILGGATTEAFVEDASFWKLREASLTFFLPDSWAASFGGESASLSLTGRNLVTWTDYTGFDPEINQIGQANFQQREFLTLPPARTWIARVNVGF